MANVALIDDGPAQVRHAVDAATGVYVNGANQLAIVSMSSGVKVLTYVSAAGAATTVPAATSGQSVRELSAHETVEITNP